MKVKEEVGIGVRVVTNHRLKYRFQGLKIHNRNHKKEMLTKEILIIIIIGLIKRNN